MKYIKLFETFIYDPTHNRKPSDIIEDIKDICVDLEDRGFTIKVYPGYFHDNSIIIENENGEIFNYLDILDVVDRLKEYLGVKRIKDISVYNGERWSNANNINVNKFYYTLQVRINCEIWNT